jgi:hypothetical protein
VGKPTSFPFVSLLSCLLLCAPSVALQAKFRLSTFYPVPRIKKCPAGKQMITECTPTLHSHGPLASAALSFLLMYVIFLVVLSGSVDPIQATGLCSEAVVLNIT